MACQKDFFVKLRSVSLILMAVLFLSCTTTIDISEDKILRGNYLEGLILESKTDMLLMYDHYLSARSRALEKVRQYGLSDEYRGIIKRGTKLRIIRVELYQHIENGNYIYPIALVLNGQWEGEEVNLHYTSRSSNSLHNESDHIDILDIDTELFHIVSY